MVRRNHAWDEREALPAEVQRAAYGPSGKGGCLKTARHQLVGDTAPPDYHAFNQLTGTALETSRRAPDVRAAQRRWHTCMAKAGFNYPEPMAAAVSKRWNTPEPTPAEHATARRRGLPAVHRGDDDMGSNRDPHPTPHDPAEHRPPAQGESPQGPLARSCPPRPEPRGRLMLPHLQTVILG
ncbi:hypothetical protein [Streptomyces kronopolitis]